MDATKIRAALKVLLGLEADDVSRDAELDNYVGVAVSAVEAYTNRKMTSEVVTDRFYTPGVAGCALAGSPIASVEAVRVDGTALAADDWRLDRGGVVSRLSGGVPTYWDGALVEIDYTVGLEVVPGWLIEATAAVAAEFEAKAGGGAIGSVKRETVPGVFSVEYATGGGTGAFGIPSEVAVLLDMIREPGIA